MAVLTDTQVDQVVLALGYESIADASRVLGRLRQEFSDTAVARIAAILANLDSYDSDLSTLLNTAQVEQLDVLKVNFQKRIASIRREASRQLRELSNIVGVLILYNKYGGRSGMAGTSVLSY